MLIFLEYYVTPICVSLKIKGLALKKSCLKCPFRFARRKTLILRLKCAKSAPPVTGAALLIYLWSNRTEDRRTP